MLFWFTAIAVTAIACTALFYAAGRSLVNAGTPELSDPNSHFRLVLSGIEADLAAGKLGEAEAVAAKGELAREMQCLKAEAGHAVGMAKEISQGSLLVGLGGVAILALGLYAALGNPDTPSQPLAGRQDVAVQSIDLGDAIARIEAALAANPDDLHGWTVIAPVYIETGRYVDAARAYHRVIELGGPTADLQTSLAEALLLGADGAGSTEAMDLLRTAAAAEPQHVMSRLYLAAELTGQGHYAEAAPLWNEAITLGKGDEPWLSAARQGLAVAESNGVASTNPQEAEMIGLMVSGLARRLAEQGGLIEEWTQLLRAYLVLGDTANAQATVGSAVEAYPQTFDRGEFDTLALGAGLTIDGATP